MGAACSRHGSEEVHAGFLWGNRRESDHFGRQRRTWEDYVRRISESLMGVMD
jgi:hypothetical protein